MSGWRDTNLGEVIELKYGKDHKHLAIGKIPAYGSGGIMRYVDTAIYEEESILIPRKGSLNNIIYESKPFWTVDTMFWSKIDKTLAYPKFLFYQLSEIDYMNLNVGSAVPSLTVPVIEEIVISLPPLEEQKAIASVLTSLDDKIELLHRQNSTLERMAETLFRQWFIEQAQEDWVDGKISDLVNILSGFAFKSTSFNDNGEYKLITIKAVQDGYLELNNANKILVLPQKLPNYCILNYGEILLSLTGNVGRCCIVDCEKLLLNQRVAKLKPKNKRDWAFTYVLFRQASMKMQLEELAKGTAQANLSPIETANMEIKIPPENILESFSLLTTSFLDKLLKNKKQIQNLEKLRDNLLPKLMSGEVSIR